MPCRRMDHQTGRLVDDQQMHIFKHHVQRHRLSPESQTLGRGHQLNAQTLPRQHLARRSLHHASFNLHMALFDQGLQKAARKFWRHRNHGFVDALTVQGIADHAVAGF